MASCNYVRLKTRLVFLHVLWALRGCICVCVLAPGQMAHCQKLTCFVFSDVCGERESAQGRVLLSQHC